MLWLDLQRSIFYLNLDELFIFVIQTDRQMKLMKKFCCKILLVDGKHGTNQYEDKTNLWPAWQWMTIVEDGLLCI